MLNSPWVSTGNGNAPVSNRRPAGPENTPYCGGCFLFDIYFPPDYPRVPPKVLIRTTGGGSVRVSD